MDPQNNTNSQFNNSFQELSDECTYNLIKSLKRSWRASFIEVPTIRLAS
jgi:hypothetical protein